MFDSRAEAEDAEVRAIRSEAPRFNRRHATKLDPEVIAADKAREHKKWRVTASTQSSGTPQYWALYQHLSQKISSGYYAPGESLPPKNHLLKSLGASGPALARAYQELENDGYIRKAGIRGYLVLPPEARRISICVGTPEEAAAAIREAMTEEQIADLIKALSA